MVRAEEAVAVLCHQAVLDVRELCLLACTCKTAHSRLLQRCTSRGIVPSFLSITATGITTTTTGVTSAISPLLSSMAFLYLHAPAQMRHRLGPFHMHASLLQQSQGEMAAFWTAAFRDRIGPMDGVTFDGSCSTPVGRFLMNSEFLAIETNAPTASLPGVVEPGAFGTVAVLHPTVNDYLAGRSRVVFITPPKHWMHHVHARTQLGALVAHISYSQGPFLSRKFHEQAATIHPSLSAPNEELIATLTFLSVPLGLQIYEAEEELTLHALLQWPLEDLRVMTRLVGTLALSRLMQHLSWQQLSKLASSHRRLLGVFVAMEPPFEKPAALVARLMLHGGFADIRVPTAAFKRFMWVTDLVHLDDKALDFFKHECESYYRMELGPITTTGRLENGGSLTSDDKESVGPGHDYTPLLQLIAHHARYRPENDGFSFADDYQAITKALQGQQQCRAQKYYEWHANLILAYALRLRGLSLPNVIDCLSMLNVVFMAFTLLDEDMTPARIQFAKDMPGQYLLAVVDAQQDNVHEMLSKPISRIVHRWIETEHQKPISTLLTLLRLDDTRQLCCEGVLQLHDLKTFTPAICKLNNPIVRDGLMQQAWDMKFVGKHRYEFTESLLRIMVQDATMRHKEFALPSYRDGGMDEICAAIETGFVCLGGDDTKDFTVNDGDCAIDPRTVSRLQWLFALSPSYQKGNWQRLHVLGLNYATAKCAPLSNLKLMTVDAVFATLQQPLPEEDVQRFIQLPEALSLALLSEPHFVAQPWFPLADCPNWSVDQIDAARALIATPNILMAFVPNPYPMRVLLDIPAVVVPSLQTYVLDLMISVEDLLSCRSVLELALSFGWFEIAANQDSLAEFVEELKNVAVQDALQKVASVVPRPAVISQFFQSLIQRRILTFKLLPSLVEYNTETLIRMLEVAALTKFNPAIFEDMLRVQSGWFERDMMNLFKNEVLTVRHVVTLQAIFPNLDPLKPGDISPGGVLATCASLKAAGEFDFRMVIDLADTLTGIDILAAFLKGQLARAASHGILKPSHFSGREVEWVLALIHFLQGEDGPALLTRLWMAQATIEDIAKFDSALTRQQNVDQFCNGNSNRGGFQFGAAVTNATKKSGKKRGTPVFTFGK